MVSPFIKWVGGKGRILSQMRDYYPCKFDNYYEPFLGGGAVFFDLYSQGKLSNKIYLNDLNKRLISVYKWIRDNPEELIKKTNVFLSYYKKLLNDKTGDFYYRKRDIFNNSEEESIKTATLFLFLNKTAYNGVYRENGFGEYNVPHGRHKNTPLLDNENINNISDILKKVKLSSISYEKIIIKAKKHDFVYFDPPYSSKKNKINFTKYLSRDFNDFNQKELSAICDKLTDKGVYVMLSNSDTPLVRKLYSGKRYRIHEIQAARAVNCKAIGRGRITELIITNY
ncbi:MAG: Dam family site-specific DNA-(adenine-N6)-methyltransferase [Candidatus Pacearchaeota archaeon]|jgi:DNA adenine methylase